MQRVIIKVDDGYPLNVRFAIPGSLWRNRLKSLINDNYRPSNEVQRVAVIVAKAKMVIPQRLRSISCRKIAMERRAGGSG